MKGKGCDFKIKRPGPEELGIIRIRMRLWFKNGRVEHIQYGQSYKLEYESDRSSK